MKRVALVSLLAVILLGSGVGTAMANVYASQVTVTGVTNGSAGSISYYLNENADNGVTLEIVSWNTQSTVRTLSGGTTVGKHTVSWDGNDSGSTPVPAGEYGVKITASDDGYSAWTQISSLDASHSMYAGRSIRINRNPTSPVFGRIYVTNYATGTPAAGLVGPQNLGLYAFNPDGSYLEGLESSMGYCTGNGDAGYPGGATDVRGPYAISIGEDDRVYVSDYRDTYENLFFGDDSFSAGSVNTLLSAGDLTNHGNILDMVIKGTGASRQMYYVDEDIIAAQGHAVMQMTIGDLTNADAVTGAEIIPPPGGSWVNLQGLCIDSAGVIYPQVYRWYPNSKPGLYRFESGTEIWALDETQYYRVYHGVVLDEDHDRLLAAYYGAADGGPTSGTLYVVNPGTGAVSETVDLIDDGVRGIGVDAAGNVYAVASTSEWWRVWSPPDGANSFVTWVNQPPPANVHDENWIRYR